MSVSIPTIKRLFGVSGNRCAFPGCAQPMVEGGVVTGKVCHIKGKKGGPRHDAGQTEEERHGFDNLVLMCGQHHTVIDTDWRSYTVARLTEIKAEHEAKYAGGAPTTDEIASQFIVNMNATPTGGSNIVTVNQMGGQVAHTITNIGKQPRQLSQTTAHAIVAALRQLPKPPHDVEVRSIMGDGESAQFGKQIGTLLQAADWHIFESYFLPAVPITWGVVVCVEQPSEPFSTLVASLRAAGFNAVGEGNNPMTRLGGGAPVSAIIIVASNV